ncbi:MAG: DNA adenine methylase [Clostridiales Family XIII bacterium]|jgi:DNA adenine methylase|nr:DNA adenine methylase [Clostridiales Family XIII bacterium]
MEKNCLVAPVLKWAGGKRQLLDALVPLLPSGFSAYCEPFVGGGALLFRLQPGIAYVNDINGELIRVYEVIRDSVEPLIQALEGFRNEAGHFYAVRDQDRDRGAYSAMSDVEKAARTLYLNKTCYNGLFRVNGAGEFNVPFGSYRKPNIVNARTLRAVSSYLNAASVRLTSLDYAEAMRSLPDGAFVYLDPPYDPVSDTSGFTGYSKGGFTRGEQARLRACCDSLHARGLKFMLSNSATPFVKELYAAYNITIVQANRAINSDSAKRGKVDEVVVRNYT